LKLLSNIRSWRLEAMPVVSAHDGWVSVFDGRSQLQPRAVRSEHS
jgi:hypothetical protein